MAGVLPAAAAGKAFRWLGGGWRCFSWAAVLVLQVNIIPIIAKADTIAKNELHKFKSKIMSELVSNGVQIYQFPTDEETVAEINATMSVCFPLSFACLGFCGPIPEGRARCAMFLLAFKIQSEIRLARRLLELEIPVGRGLPGLIHFIV